MADLVTKSCNECSTQKRESNHWWVLIYRAEPIHSGSKGTLSLFSYEEFYGPKERRVKLTDRAKKLDLCSEQCVNVAVGKWMRGGLGK